MNKIRINKRLQEVLDEHKRNQDIPHLAHNLFGFRAGLIKLDEESRFCEAFVLFKKYDYEDTLNILSGNYEVIMSREELVMEAYQDNYEIACTTPDVAKQWESNGFNKGVRFMNDLYKLNIKLEEK